MTFESIVQLEDVIFAWISTIPNEFRLCDDFKDIGRCMEKIDETSDYMQLFTFIHCQMLIIGIYSYLLQPIKLGRDYDQLLPRVQQRSLENTLNGCRLLIHATNRVSKLEGKDACKFLLFFILKYTNLES